MAAELSRLVGETSTNSSRSPAPMPVAEWRPGQHDNRSPRVFALSTPSFKGKTLKPKGSSSTSRRVLAGNATPPSLPQVTAARPRSPSLKAVQAQVSRPNNPPAVVEKDLGSFFSLGNLPTVLGTSEVQWSTEALLAITELPLPLGEEESEHNLTSSSSDGTARAGGESPVQVGDPETGVDLGELVLADLPPPPPKPPDWDRAGDRP